MQYEEQFTISKPHTVDWKIAGLNGEIAIVKYQYNKKRCVIWEMDLEDFLEDYFTGYNICDVANMKDRVQGENGQFTSNWRTAYYNKAGDTMKARQKDLYTIEVKCEHNGKQHIHLYNIDVFEVMFDMRTFKYIT